MNLAQQEERDERLATSAFTLANILVGNGPTKKVLQLGLEIRDYFFYCVDATQPRALLQRIVSAAIRLRLASEWKLYACQKKVLEFAVVNSPDLHQLWGEIRAERSAWEFSLLGAAGSPTSMAVVRSGIREGFNPDDVARLFRSGQLWIDPKSRKLKAWQHRPVLFAWAAGLIIGLWLVALGLTMHFELHAHIDFVLSFIVGSIACAVLVGYQLFNSMKQEQHLLDKVADAYQPRVVAGK